MPVPVKLDDIKRMLDTLGKFEAKGQKVSEIDDMQG
jgi:hypothetical protein